MTNSIVSVIIPVYNVEKYLSHCLESVCNQTYPFLEIIVIDDESPDSSGKIADDFAIKDNRIKVLHIKNRGAAGARNVGLDNCTGDYVFFVDSDDWIEENTIEVMLNKLIHSNVDIVQCQYFDEYKSQSIKHKCNHQAEEYDDEEFIGDMITHWEDSLIWNKIYKSQLFNGVRFIEGRCIDDEFFTYKIIANSDKIAIVPNYLYHYLSRKSSAMGSDNKSKQRQIDQVDFVMQRYSVLIHMYPKLKKQLLQHMCEVLMFVMRNSGNAQDAYVYAKSHLKRYAIPALLHKGINVSMKKSIAIYLFGNKKRLQPDAKIDIREDYFD